MTEGEKMVWAAAYAAEYQATLDADSAVMFASETVIGLRNVKRDDLETVADDLERDAVGAAIALRMADEMRFVKPSEPDEFAQAWKRLDTSIQNKMYSGGGTVLVEAWNTIKQRLGVS